VTTALYADTLHVTVDGRTQPLQTFQAGHFGRGDSVLWPRIPAPADPARDRLSWIVSRHPGFVDASVRRIPLTLADKRVSELGFLLGYDRGWHVANLSGMPLYAQTWGHQPVLVEVAQPLLMTSTRLALWYPRTDGRDRAGRSTASMTSILLEGHGVTDLPRPPDAQPSGTTFLDEHVVWTHDAALLRDLSELFAEHLAWPPVFAPQVGSLRAGDTGNRSHHLADNLIAVAVRQGLHFTWKGDRDAPKRPAPALHEHVVPWLIDNGLLRYDDIHPTYSRTISASMRPATARR
jgi:hypothetical protein